MDTNNHELGDLFRQLGLPAEPGDIEQFIATHRLPDGTRLADAQFWTPSQAQFLREEFVEDADWAEVIDQLNVALSR